MKAKFLMSTAILVAMCGTVQAENTADKPFVMAAAQGGMAEVEAGQLAIDKGVSADVKKFGETLVKDHTKANDELKTIAKSKNIELPTDVTAEQKKHHDMLAGLEGEKFDQEFIKHMVKGHEETIAKFRTESKSGKDADLKEFATNTLPTLEEHLKTAKSLEKK